MTRQAPAPGPEVTFGVLGPVRAATARGPVPLKGPRQRAVLARLLIAAGRVVPTDLLVTDLWERPPDGAVAAIRTFVSDLRRALEPDRPPRRPARLLVTAPPGYALRVEPDAVDARRFEAAVGAAGDLLSVGRAGPALDRLDEALALWHGPAYAECADKHWARAEIDRLDDLRMLAVERRAEALLGLERTAEAASDLRAHASDHPLREHAWELLATALYRSGRQGEALAVLRRARQTLVAELGVDPGPRLRRLEADMLAQAPGLDGAPGRADRSGAPAGSDWSGALAGSDWSGALAGSDWSEVPGGRVAPDPARADAKGERPCPAAVTPDRRVVGRNDELAVLVRAAEETAARRRPGLALISGDLGTGKTALAETLAETLAAAGWTTAWGRSPEYDGAPVAWPWTQISEALTSTTHLPGTGSMPSGQAVRRSADDDPTLARFRLYRDASALLGTVAGNGPVLLVLDDLHRADEDTLDLLTALLTGPQPAVGPILITGTFRATEITPELTAALGRLAGTEPVRVYLGGLPEAATGELAGAVTRTRLDPGTVRALHRRSGGNPFFVRELARLLATEGGRALETVPAGVRDVVRHRLAQLPDPALDLLRQAAVIGRDVDPEVLTALVGDDAPLLDALDHAVRAGFLTEPRPAQPDAAGSGPGTAGRLRFTHILVRDTLYGDLSAPRRARWHADVGAVIERLYPDDVATLAHHFANAAGRSAADRAARYARAAAEQAERRCRPHHAAHLWRQAVVAHDRGGGDERGRLAAVMGLGRALAITGRLAEARRCRAEAITVAEALAAPDVLADVLVGFGVPAIWTSNDDPALAARIVAAADHTLAARGDGPPGWRARLLGTLALELRGTTSDRGHRAAVEAETLARSTGDPGILAFALNARFMHAFTRTGLAPERARIGAELVDLAARHDLVTFQVLGHLIQLQARCALADLAAADGHASAADGLADRYGLPLVGVFTAWYAALRLAIGGRRENAEAAYLVARHRLAEGGMPGMERGLLPLALFSLRSAARPTRTRVFADRPGAEPAPPLADRPGAARPPGAAPVSPGERGGNPHSGASGPDGGGNPDSVSGLDGGGGEDWGPFRPWLAPLGLLAAGRTEQAATALRATPESPHDLLWEARLCLTARAAIALNDHTAMRYAYERLLPAAEELAGAGSGVLSFGPVAGHLGDLAVALGRPDAAAYHRAAQEIAARVIDRDRWPAR